MQELDLPWVEKYRPKKLKEVVGQEEITKRLEAYVKAKNMPNLLFAGRAGIGKTASALALAHELYGDNIARNFLELNASDERGIDVIRGKIKDFAATMPYGDVPFKIIFLDEADALTRDAQQALRRTMEKYSKTCRFILSCNYSSKIIEPIQSRCALFRFKPLSDKDIIKRLEHIAKKEELEVTKDGYQAIVYIAEGDMRKAINTLQVASIISKKIDESVVYKVASRARPEEVRKMVELSLAGKFTDARKQLDKLLYEHGLSAEDILLQLHKEVMNIGVDDRTKLEIIDKVGEVDFRITEGANERLQLESLLAELVLMTKK